MLVASTAPSRSTMSARWAWIGSAGSAGARLDRHRGRDQRHPPGDGREAEDEDDPEQQEPRLGLGPLGAVPRLQPGGALLGLDEVRVLALGAGAEDAGERAQRAADHWSAAGSGLERSGRGAGSAASVDGQVVRARAGRRPSRRSPNWSGVSSASPSPPALARDERLQPVGPVEIGPFRVQDRDRLALVGDLAGAGRRPGPSASWVA